jgi:SRSO17 transposase
MPTVMDFEALADYQNQLRGAFRRKDQARWAGVYLQGLLLDLPRKNIETLARHVTLPPGLPAEDATQALHNFISNSPWDEHELWRRYRALMAGRLGRTDGVFLLDEITFAKQGAHSVGVQRQYSSAVGAKINCQVAVAVYYVSAAGRCPLALRLYLPGRWLASAERLDAAGVPPAYRRRLRKAQLGRQLIEEIRGEGFPGRSSVAVQPSGASAEPLERPPNDSIDLREHRLHTHHIRKRLKGLGLDHFEGRSWRGFHHHACLVMVAYGFLLDQDAEAAP